MHYSYHLSRYMHAQLVAHCVYQFPVLGIADS